METGSRENWREKINKNSNLIDEYDSFDCFK